MKKKLFLVTLMIMGVLLAGCAHGNDVSYSTDATMPIEVMTGYPDGEIQRPYLFYNGTLYQYKFECRKVPKDKIIEVYGYEFVGSVNKTSNVEMPDEEMEASRFSVGAEIYANDTSIIVYENGFVNEMEKVNTP